MGFPARGSGLAWRRAVASPCGRHAPGLLAGLSGAWLCLAAGSAHSAACRLAPGLIDDYQSIVVCLKQAQERIELLEVQADARNADLCGLYEDLRDLRAETGRPARLIPPAGCRVRPARK
jgi:hypothetical protein